MLKFSLYRHLSALTLIFLLAYPAVGSLLGNKSFPVHDDTQQARIYVMSQELKNNQFPVRLVGDLGYGFGYPIFNFYAPLPYYFGSLFYIGGLDLFASTNLMYLSAFLLAGVSMYFLAFHLAGRSAGIAAAILYLYAPYHAVNLYVRGAVGELYAYAFLPLYLLGMYLLVKRDNKFKERSVILIISGLSGIILSHNITALITLFFSLLFLPLWFRERQTFFRYLFSMAGAIGLSSFFIIPAILENSFTSVSQLSKGSNSYNLHFVYLSQLWDSAWGFAGSASGLADGMSFKIGKWHVVLSALAALNLFRLYLSKNLKARQWLFYICALILLFTSILMTLPVSSPVYRLLPWFDFIQYPWRFLNFILLFSVILISSLFTGSKKYFKHVLAAVVIIFSLILYPKYFQPQFVSKTSEKEYLRKENLRFTVSKISDEYLPLNFTRPQSFLETYRTAFEATVIKETTLHKIYHENGMAREIITSMAYFPGWQIKINGQTIPVGERDGRIAFKIPAGTNQIEFTFSDTPIRYLSNVVSILSLCLILYLTCRKKHPLK